MPAASLPACQRPCPAGALPHRPACSHTCTLVIKGSPVGTKLSCTLYVPLPACRRPYPAGALPYPLVCSHTHTSACEPVIKCSMVGTKCAFTLGWMCHCQPGKGNSFAHASSSSHMHFSHQRHLFRPSHVQIGYPCQHIELHITLLNGPHTTFTKSRGKGDYVTHPRALLRELLGSRAVCTVMLTEGLVQHRRRLYAEQIPQQEVSLRSKSAQMTFQLSKTCFGNEIIH